MPMATMKLSGSDNLSVVQDIIFNFEKAYFILDELVMSGEVQETSKKAVLKQIEFADNYQEEEIISLALKDVGLI